MPARPANVAGCAPSATPSRVISASPRVMSAARELKPEPDAFDDSGRDRHDVLERAAELDADDVVVRVDAKRRVAERAPAPARAARIVVDAATTAVGCRAATSAAKLGPESATTGVPGSSLARRRRVISASVSRSMPLVATHERRVARDTAGAASRSDARADACDGVA